MKTYLAFLLMFLLKLIYSCFINPDIAYADLSNSDKIGSIFANLLLYTIGYWILFALIQSFKKTKK